MILEEIPIFQKIKKNIESLNKKLYIRSKILSFIEAI